MRKAIFALVFVVIIAALSPFAFGLYTEHYYKRLVGEAQLPQGVYMELATYKRGYLRSEASYELNVYQPGATPQAIPELVLTLTGHDEIHHGPLFLEAPFFAAATTRSYITADDIDISGITHRDISEFFDDEAIIEANSIISFNQSIATNIKISGINEQVNDALYIQWDGLDTQVKLSKNLFKHFISIDFSPLLVQVDEKPILDISRITLVSDAKRTSTTPWIGEQDISIPAISYENKAGDRLRLDDFMLSADTTMKKGVANFDMNIRAGNLEIMSELIENLNISASFHHMDAASLLRIGQIIHGEETLSPKDKQELSQTVIYLFTPGSEITVDGSAHLDTGDIEGNINILFPDVTAITDEETAEAVAQALVMRLEADLSYSVPMGTLEEILYFIASQGIPANATVVVNEETGETMPVQDLIRQSVNEEITLLSNNNILLSDGKSYTLQLGYDRGAVILNGARLEQEDLARIMSIFNQQPQ